MPIHYQLVESDPRPDSTSYLAQVQVTSTANLDVIASRMIAQGIALPKGELLPLLESLVRAVEGLLLDGQRVNVGGLVDLSPRIRGEFLSPEDTFNAERHQLDVQANAGSRLRIAIRTRGQARRTVSNRPAPSLSELATLETGTTLQGNHLKFDPSRPDEGIFLLPVTGGEPLRISSVLENKTKKLVFRLPELPAGQYHLEVRTRLANSSELRTGRFSDPLTAD